MSSNDFMNDERFDGLYMNVAQTTRGIDPLLDTLFGFLRRKTDFFTERGTDAAVEKVNQVLNRHADLVQKEQKEKEAKASKKKAKTAAVQKEEEPVVEMGTDGGFDVSAPTKPSTTTTSQPKKPAPKPKPAPVEEKKTSDDATSKPVATDKDDSKRGPSPIGNGGTVDGKYVWTQTLSEVNVNIPLPENTRGKDLNVTFAKQHIKVALRGSPPTVIVDAPLRKPIICDDSFWTVEDGNRLALNLQKLNGMEWWDSVCEGDPKIDLQAIQPESSKVSDLDGDTRKTVEKMMYDQRQKALGLPTTAEEEKQNMFEKFKREHPELDFSNAKIT